ncbi:MAG: GNAT family N-acetyltransferase [Proteobacteria bacterium]|nr:GNAT family N-acetyltransferase [Pseudomonadota bacterium]
MAPIRAPVSRRARPEDAPRIARLFAAAFRHDPIFNWLSRTGSARGEAMQRFFLWALRERTMPHGETWISRNGYAAAAWIPPYTKAGPITLRDELRALPVIWGLTGLMRLARGAAMASAIERVHPKEPHFYLAFIGVAPRFQGAGLGTQLLKETLGRVDAAGASAYLENSHMRNIALYERFGFQVIDEVVARRDAPPLYAMWRAAKRPENPNPKSQI